MHSSALFPSTSPFLIIQQYSAITGEVSKPYCKVHNTHCFPMSQITKLKCPPTRVQLTFVAYTNQLTAEVKDLQLWWCLQRHSCWQSSPAGFSCNSWGFLLKTNCEVPEDARKRKKGSECSSVIGSRGL